ncbi:MAG: hypothetical protein GFH27_549297n32 [Chloroflexi bacterium AL-W]|nr:hypothetical protein [Chloroflexi bacterium AL-N1]NOK68558.1 hypothetical protein [Chloroflexi bacterium AL-N10]NOK76044.1 hypothetical protein [Chloroflexi bacterium AL-N5]NOK82515.1 hypothetical protein [Chloroflexi bacterium AL-W]NOK92827.1 hypothetical protein [Chloroflexi bacterium AL-N15]
MTAQDGLYATKRTHFDPELPLSTLKIEGYITFDSPQSTETLVPQSLPGHKNGYITFDSPQSTETQ